MSLQSFRYRARDPAGKLVTGKLEAESPTEVKRILAGRQLAVLDVGASASDRFQDILALLEGLFGGGISLEEMIVFNRQLQTSYSVGMSVLQALTLISEQTQSEAFRRVISSVIEDLTEGHALHAALAKHPKVFDYVYVNTIKAGEASGRLDEILGMLSASAEQRMENRAKVKSAIFYPKIVLAAMLIVIVVVVTFVIPKFETFYARFGGQLPPLTVFVVGVSHFVGNYWYALAAAAGGLYWAFRRFVSTASGRLAFDRLLLRVPVFGPILLQYDLLTFATVFRLLLASGIPIVEALAIVRESLDNQVLKNEVEEMRQEIERGGSLSRGLQRSRFFPRMVGNLVAVGEEGGKVEEVLEKVGSYYKVQLDFRLNNLSKAIEPAFLVLIFGMVLVLVLSIFLPIWKMSQLLRPH